MSAHRQQASKATQQLKRFLRAAILAGLLLGASADARADFKDEIGFTTLAAELGAALPTGANVNVAQVEARTDTAFPVDSSPNYLPDSSHADFVGKTIVARSANAEISSHATNVGRFFYGNSGSVSPSVSSIDAYWADDWLGAGFLKRNTTTAPARPRARVFNHSWVGPSDSLTLEALKRTDFLVETYDTIQVVGVNNDDNGSNPVQPLLAGAYNVIAVGKTNGEHAIGTQNIGPALYRSGRVKPDLVAPFTFTSGATPAVASSVALLVDLGHNNPSLSLGSYTVPADVGNYLVRHAEASEVIKAALMAGAQRTQINDYTVNSTNGLSNRWGAGELDIYNSYHIIAAGEQNSSERLGGRSIIDRRGFDYDPLFNSGSTASYYFTPDVNSTMLSASLAWNVDIVGGAGTFNSNASLANFDLNLFEVGAGGNTLIAASASSIENTENLWRRGLTPGAEYLLQVTRNDALGGWDYGLAWQLAHDPASPLYGDMNGDLRVDLLDIDPFILALTNRTVYDGRFVGIDADIQGDVNRDGLLNHLDLDGMGRLLGSAFVGIGQGESPPAVPEPGTLMLLLLGAGGLLLWRRRQRRPRDVGIV